MVVDAGGDYGESREKRRGEEETRSRFRIESEASDRRGRARASNTCLTIALWLEKRTPPLGALPPASIGTNAAHVTMGLA
jgi:hypothetical protein